MSNPLTVHSDAEPFPPMAAVCRGCYALNSACGKCARCAIDPMNPANLGAAPPAAGVKPEINVGILALDLGNHLGYALRRRDGRILHGAENFSPRASWTPGQRWQRFRAWLNQTVVEHQIGALAFEIVIQGGSMKDGGHKSGAAGDVYGGYKAMVELAADSHRLELHPVHVATVKKHWTGDGHAKKDAMVLQAKARGFRVQDDNEADGLAVLHWAIAKMRGEWQPTPRPKPKPKAGRGTGTATRKPVASSPAPGLFDNARGRS